MGWCGRVGVSVFVSVILFFCFFFVFFGFFFFLLFLFTLFFINISDSGYTDNNTYKMLIPTAWIPLLDANETNGCLQVCNMLIASASVKAFFFISPV